MHMLMKVNTAVIVPANIFPLTDDGDFKSREVSVAYNAAGMDLVWNFVTASGVQSQTAITPTTSGNYDWAHVGDGMYSIELPASGNASVGNGWITGIATGILAWRGPVITMAPANIVDSFINGTDVLDVSAIQILGTAISAPATAGILDVNVKNMNNVAATSITTISANQGTTQPINFTGSAGSALVKSDTVDIAGAAVSTTAAQIGVNVVNISGTLQTARDIGSSVLVSSGTGTGQLDVTSGVVKANTVYLGGALQTGRDIGAGVLLTSGTGLGQVVITSGVLSTNLTQISGSGISTDVAQLGVNTVSLSANAITATSINTGAIAAAKIGSAALTTAKFAAGAIDSTILAANCIGSGQLDATAVTKIQTGLATPTNISAGTITTVTNLTNAPTNGDLTATMKNSVTTAATAATPTAAGVDGNITGSVGSVIGNISGNVIGYVGSIAVSGISPTSFYTDAISARSIASDAVTEIQAGLLTLSGLLDTADTVETSVSVRLAIRALLAAVAGQVTGGGTTTIALKNAAGTKTRAQLTVDASGNRSSITYDNT